MQLRPCCCRSVWDYQTYLMNRLRSSQTSKK